MSISEGSRIGNYPYRIVRQLGVGEGGMSEIYLATLDEGTNLTDEKLVVLKIVDLEGKNKNFFEETLQNEVETLRRLKNPGHSGVVILHDIQGLQITNRVYTAQTKLPNQPWFFVMEYLAGGSLADLLKKQKKIDIGLAIQIIHQVNQALVYIHGQGFVHLDIKPENILFRFPLGKSNKLETVLIDFGISRGIGQSGLEAGTLIWCSPERIASTLTANSPADVSLHPEPSMDTYALGMVFYHMLTGKLPFKKRMPKRTTEAILMGNPQPPSTYNSKINKQLDQFILSMIAKDPKERPNAKKLKNQLNSLAKTYSFNDDELTNLAHSSTGRLRLAVMVVLFALLLLVGGLWGSGQFDTSPELPAESNILVPESTLTVTQLSTIAVNRRATSTTVEFTPSVTHTSSAVPSTATAEATFTSEPTSTLQPTSTLLPTGTPKPTTITTPSPIKDDGEEENTNSNN